MNELDLVVLRKDLPSKRLKAGDVGTIVLKHAEGAGFEVEFTTFSGETIAVLTMRADDLRPVGADEIAHARHVA